MKEAVRRTTKNRGICNFYEKMEENLCLIWMAVKPHTAETACFQLSFSVTKRAQLRPCLFLFHIKDVNKNISELKGENA